MDLGTGIATGGSGADSLKSIENVIGSRFDDVLVGNAAANRFDGFLGNDIIDGKGGIDTVLYNLAVRPVTVNLATGKVNGGAPNTQRMGTMN